MQKIFAKANSTKCGYASPENIYLFKVNNRNTRKR